MQVILCLKNKFTGISLLGKAPAYKIFDLVKVERKDKTKQARQFDDYSVKIDRDNVPNGVTLKELI